jgi:hypothetical protein
MLSFLLAFMNQKSRGKAQLPESLCCILILYISSLHCCHRHIHGHRQDLFQGGCQIIFFLVTVKNAFNF